MLCRSTGLAAFSRWLSFSCGRQMLFLWLAAAVLGGTAAQRQQAARNRRASPRHQRYVCSADELKPPAVAVHLTVSSLTKPRSREIELNWRYGPGFAPWSNDTVTLTLGDPARAGSIRLTEVTAANHPSLSYRTGYKFNHGGLETMQNHCTRYWIAYSRGTQMLAKNCIKVLPNWMWQNRRSLSAFSVDELMLPGTHNSGTYKRSRDIVFKLVTTQDQDVWSQLMYGNRYLDLRVGYRPSDTRSPFWVYHDFFPVRPMTRIINHVKWFLNSTRDVVILDMHRFPVGFDDHRVHDLFVEYLQSELGRWMAPRIYDVTLGELWASDRRLLVPYGNSAARRRSEYLWPAITQAWGNQQSVQGLFDYLREQMRQRAGGRPWAAMAELTASPWDILIPNRGLRDLAQKVNSHVTKWFRDEWWDKANVVATDFYMGNDMVDVAIEANLKRRQCLPDLAERRVWRSGVGGVSWRGHRG